MDRVDIVIIGAGVVGLAIAERLSAQNRQIIVAEKHDGFGREASSRNSEVIHAGLYYSEKLLKTQLCVKGNPMLYEFCKKRDIPYRKTGKLVVATSEDEIDSIHALLKQGTTNGVPGLRLLTRSEIKTMAPHIFSLAALYSPESGIIDSHQLMKYLEYSAESKGTVIAYNCEVIGLQKNNDLFTVHINDADGGQIQLEACLVINSAGLGSDKIASMAEIDIDAAGYRIYPCKGEYFSVSNRHRGKLKHLVYPVPTSVYLGAHASLSLDGRLKIGPSAFYVDSLNYDVNPENQRSCFTGAHKLLPFIEYNDLSPDMSGIRPKLYKEQEPFRDFIIHEESEKGLAGLINLIGIESPGLTSCLSIAENVETLITV